MKKQIATLAITVSLFLAIFNVTSQISPVKGMIEIGGHITSDTTWTPVDTYLVIADTYVDPGVTLTIEPDVQVQFADGFSLLVEGSLVAIGTEANPITFTSNSSSPSPGAWNSIRFKGNSNEQFLLKNVKVEYAIHGVAIESLRLAIIEESEIHNCSESGIYIIGKSNILIKENTLTQNKNGIATDSTQIHSGIYIINNTISSNIADGIYLYSYDYAELWDDAEGHIHNITISDNIVDSNKGNGIYLYSYGKGEFGWGRGYIYNVTVSNNIVHSNEGSGIYLYSCGESKFRRGYLHNVTVSNNIVHSNEGNGVYLRSHGGPGYLYDAAVVGNRAYRNGGTGLYLHADGRGTAKMYNISVSKNSADFNNGAGLVVIARSADNPYLYNAIISENTARFNNGVGMFISSHAEGEGPTHSSLHNVTILDNLVHGNSDNGIHLESLSWDYGGYPSSYGYLYNTFVLGNSIGGNKLNGLTITAGEHYSLSKPYDLVICDNSLYSNVNAGIWFARMRTHGGESFHTNITRNTIGYNSYGILYTKSTQNAAHYNDIFENRYGMNVTNGAEVNATYCYWGDPGGPYNPSANPDGKGNPVNGDGIDLLFAPYLKSNFTFLDQRPIAALAISNTNPETNMKVTFDAQESYDPDGLIAYYFFDFGDGTDNGWTDSSIATHKYILAGTYNATLKVIDGFGVTSFESYAEIAVTQGPQVSTYPWPTFHQDNERSGHTESPAPKTNHTLWIRDLTAYLQPKSTLETNSIIAALGYIFISGHWRTGSDYTGFLCALNQSNGKGIWVNKVFGLIPFGIAYSNGRLFVTFHRFQGEQRIECLHVLTGDVMWSKQLGRGILYSYPAIDDGKVFVSSTYRGAGNIPLEAVFYCLDELTGHVIWTYDLFQEADSLGAWDIYGINVLSPSISDDYIFTGVGFSWGYATGGGIICALNKTTGAKLWDYKLDWPSESKPSAVVNEKLITSPFGIRASKVYCLNITTGEQKWITSVGARYTHNTPALAYGKVFCYGYEWIEYDYQHLLYALNEENGTNVWTKSLGQGDMYHTPPIASDGKVFATSYDILYCLDASNGSVIWYYKFTESASPPIVVDGVVFAMASDSLYAFGHPEEAFIDVAKIKYNPWNPLDIPFENMNDARDYVLNFVGNGKPEAEFGTISIEIAIENVGLQIAQNVAVEGTISGIAALASLDEGNREDDYVYLHLFEYSYSYSVGTIEPMSTETFTFEIPVKYVNVFCGVFKYNEDDEADVLFIAIELNVDLEISGTNTNKIQELIKLTGIGNPYDLAGYILYGVLNRLKDKMLVEVYEQIAEYVLWIATGSTTTSMEVTAGQMHVINTQIPPGTTSFTISTLLPSLVTLVTLTVTIGVQVIGIVSTPVAGIATLVVLPPDLRPGDCQIVVETASPDVNITLFVTTILSENTSTVFEFPWKNKTYYINVYSNCTVFNPNFNDTRKMISFDISGQSETTGFCNITIPETLMWVDALDEWNVTINGVPLSTQERTVKYNGTHYSMYFTCSTSTITIQVISKYVVPEFPSFLILPLFMIATLLLAMIHRRKRTH